jgi:two-component system phosphate regulon sensor histidine kinase PhoR
MATAAAFVAGALLGGAVAGWAAWRLAERRAAEYGRLFSFAMHEINTPVTAVNMTIINLLSGVFGEVAPDQVRWVEMMRDQVGRLNALVGEIRDLVHLEQHLDLRTSVEDAAPAEIVEQALTSMTRGFAHAGIELAVAVAPELPNVRTDADRAARSVASLLFHARKFRLSGPVSLSVKAAGSAVEFSIRYRGQKILPAEVRRSLELFYPAHRRSDQILAATGLGLGLVREVMTSLGGDVDLTVDGAGDALLTMRLPVSAAA